MSTKVFRYSVQCAYRSCVFTEVRIFVDVIRVWLRSSVIDWMLQRVLRFRCFLRNFCFLRVCVACSCASSNSKNFNIERQSFDIRHRLEKKNTETDRSRSTLLEKLLPPFDIIFLPIVPRRLPAHTVWSAVPKKRSAWFLNFQPGPDSRPPICSRLWQGTMDRRRLPTNY